MSFVAERVSLPSFIVEMGSRLTRSRSGLGLAAQLLSHVTDKGAEMTGTLIITCRPFCTPTNCQIPKQKYCPQTQGSYVDTQHINTNQSRILQYCSIHSIVIVSQVCRIYLQPKFRTCVGRSPGEKLRPVVAKLVQHAISLRHAIK